MYLVRRRGGKRGRDGIFGALAAGDPFAEVAFDRLPFLAMLPEDAEHLVEINVGLARVILP